ncbi:MULTISPECIES: hypothetical protein [Streptomycetaceae]|uniref:Uncharacterized protein n=1 Tax=Streptantibioticus cattleyicolor (strain ATCC 35852 / DSM 46488 / JCM 4925 / NBRC 14057 / NRRL 8057) TaxID=1003195 RepID=F8JS17_STREN|nr:MULTISPECIES: hypothetical protein [Streptomycetaceae]AEW92926.1 hypothetical protein SCATT_05550 [Streptantibioticus cattleyicolor NRRL 8057 = DSM 46488]MYS57674.1 hypothetical protein [Streptomyces sp. SID5468]CCB73286.1 protein of unknown function [Streptantibioticus cattleyicolor NRRL 8057 = DSM 46488]
MTHTCARCGAPSAVQWLRRPTPGEHTAINATAAQRRAEILELADPDRPPPIGPGLTEATDHTVAVYACSTHTITLDLATRIHASTCTAPHESDLPQCDCTPEPPPKPQPRPGDPGTMVTLPTGWVVPAPAERAPSGP